MAKATETFASYLGNFAHTMDIIDENTANRVWEIAEAYLEKYLGIDFLSLKVGTYTDGQPALTTVRGKFKDAQTFSVLTDGSPNAQSSYSVFNNRCLWIVESGKGLLSSSVDHLDLWHKGVDDFPKNPNDKDPEVKTSIFLPVEKDHQVVAIVEYEAKRLP